MSRVSLWTQSGEKLSMTTDEIVSRDLNRFKGWNCTMGNRNLFIDGVGDIFPGACVAGFKAARLGNIFSTEDIRKSPPVTVCSLDYCPCQPEIELKKFRSNVADGGSTQAEPSSVNALLDSLTAVELETKFLAVDAEVFWALNRRCNYSCFYCRDDVHNKTDQFRTFEEYLTMIQKITNYFGANVRRMRFTFLGGEPSLYKDLIKIVKFLTERFHHVSIVTNLSRPADFYAEILRYENSGVSASLHFEFIEDEAIFKKIEQISSLMIKNKATSVFDVKLMAYPDVVDRALELGAKVRKLRVDNPRLTLRIVNVRSMGSHELLHYSEAQLNSMIEFNRSADVIG